MARLIAAGFGLVVALLLAMASPVGAQYVGVPGGGPNVGGRDGGAGSIETGSASLSSVGGVSFRAPSVESPAARPSVGGGLAVTGADFALLTAIGVGAVGVGVVLRRRSRPATS